MSFAGITGDKHLLNLRRFEGIRILSITEILELMKGDC